MSSLLKKSLWGLGFFALLTLLGVARFVWLSSSFDPKEPLSLPDKVIVYSGHATMVAGGFLAGYPEVAQEAFYLHVPGPERRYWRSDFPAHSPLVQEHMAVLRKQIVNGQSRATTRVAWTHYTQANQRWGLALNALQLVAERSKGHIHYQGTVECSYPEDAPIVLPTGLGFGIPLNEGLYRSLEKAGWLHPYDAVWVWSEEL